MNISLVLTFGAQSDTMRAKVMKNIKSKTNYMKKQKGGYMQITVKQARVGKGLKQIEMAERLGVSLPTYSKWERTPEKIKYENLLKIASITGCTISDLKIGAEQ